MVDLELGDGLAVITIDRPDVRNAIGLHTMDELEKALDTVASAHVLVIKGAGDRAFISGGDLKELAAIRTEDQATEMALRMRRICDRIARFPAPVIAALNGHALGGGAEVAVAADIRIAAADVKIGFTQVNLAIMPAWGGAERLAGLVGRGRALLLAGTGRVLTAAEARDLGLVDEVVPRPTFEDAWRSLARSLAHPAAREIKRITGGGVPTTEAARAFARLWVSDEHWTAAERLMTRKR
jgi:enoyl-CoA hydratase